MGVPFFGYHEFQAETDSIFEVEGCAESLIGSGGSLDISASGLNSIGDSSSWITRQRHTSPRAGSIQAAPRIPKIEKKLNGGTNAESELFNTTAGSPKGTSSSWRVVVAVIVKKLQGNEIPDQLRKDIGDLAFQVTDDLGGVHYTDGEEQAAKLAVELSEQAKGRQHEKLRPV